MLMFSAKVASVDIGAGILGCIGLVCLLSQLHHGRVLFSGCHWVLELCNNWYRNNVGFRRQCYFQALRIYLMPLKGFEWFLFLVILDLFACVTTLIHFFNVSCPRKFSEKNQR